MTIRVYPSRLEGEPLETHETTERLSIVEWLMDASDGHFRIEAEDTHPTILLNGEDIQTGEWALTYFSPDDYIDVYVEPRAAGGAAIVAWAAVAIAAVALVMVLTMSKPGAPKGRRQGSTMGEPGALANSVRWGDPIPDIAGSPITYPDYIMPPRRYYVNRTEQWVDSLVCIGVGEYQHDPAQRWIGDTSAPSMGDDVEIRVFGPGETIPAPYNEWWHTPEEVGFTSIGGAGMTLGPASSVTRAWTNSISFQGQDITGAEPVPGSWENGMLVRVEAEAPLVFDGASVQSSVLDALNVSTGDDIELTGGRAGVYTVASILPGTGGSSGSAGRITGSIAPTRYDFGATHAALAVQIGAQEYTISLTADVAGLAELIDAINAQINGTRIRAQSSGSALEILEVLPYSGSAISVSGDVSTLLGSPSVQQGSAETLPSGTRYVVSGADFGEGSEVAAAGLAGFLYAIVDINGSTIRVNPGEMAFWAGFPSDVSDATSAAELAGASVQGGWIGPFSASPRGESADAFEVDIFYPQGLIHYDKKGREEVIPSAADIQWRYVGEASWNSRRFTHSDATQDQIGFTIRVYHDPGRVEVRVRRDKELDWKNTSERMQWTGLRSRIIGAPTSYPNMTTMHVRLRSGDKVSGSVEDKMSVRALRILPTIEDPEVMAPTRDIAPYFVYMMGTVGYGHNLIDMAHISALHGIWSERGDYFDLSVNDSSTLKTVANYCLRAGFAELTLKNGRITAARDAYRLGTPSRIYSPQELRAGGEIIESTKTVMPDDIDGVDIEYIDYLTGREVTEQYRLPGDQGLRVETIKAPGVTRRTQAWRLAARRRREEAYRRTAFKGGTELAAMNSYYMDYVGLQDGIPEYGQSAFVLEVDGLTLTLSEPVLPGSTVARIRRRDGTATDTVAITSVNGHVITLESVPSGTDITADPGRATVLYIGTPTQIMHEALITDVRPSGNGTVEFQAVVYDGRVYAEDDNEPGGET